MLHTKRLLLVLAVSVGATGCGLMIQQMVGRPSTKVSQPNPLGRGGGGTLVARAEPKDHMVRTYANPESCSSWPVGDEYEVEVTEAEVCVAVRWVSDVPSRALAGDDEDHPTATVTITSGGRSLDVPVALDPRVDRVATCSAPNVNNGSIDAWARRYTGCAANDGLITAASTSMTIDEDVTFELTP